MALHSSIPEEEEVVEDDEEEVVEESVEDSYSHDDDFEADTPKQSSTPKQSVSLSPPASERVSVQQSSSRGVRVSTAKPSPPPPPKPQLDPDVWNLAEFEYLGRYMFLRCLNTNLVFTDEPPERYPHLVGKWDEDSQKIARLSAADKSLLGGDKWAMEALTMTNEAARKLASAGLHHLIPELCGVLGMCQASEFSQLSLAHNDLLSVKVNPDEVLSSRLGLPEQRRFSPNASSVQVLAEHGEGLEGMQQLLQLHGLAPFLAVAVEQNVTRVADLGRLVEAIVAGPSGRLSTFQKQRWQHLTRNLAEYVKAAQLQRLRQQQDLNEADRLLALQRPTVGTLVLYDALPGTNRVEVKCHTFKVRALQAGIIVEDKGTAGHMQPYRVRNLETNEEVWCTSGQVERARPEALARHIRPDFAPPTTLGVPVTANTAAPGLPVTRGYHWEDAGPGSPREGSSRFAHYSAVVGTLVKEEPVLFHGQIYRCWLVQWPDGTEYEYSVGDDGRFELCHFCTHRLMGAPFMEQQRRFLLSPGDVVTLPVLRSPLTKTPEADGIACTPGTAIMEWAKHGVRVVWSANRQAGEQTYTPQDSGDYDLCHSIFPGQPVTVFTAKEGAKVTLRLPPSGSVASSQGSAELVSALEASKGSKGGEPKCGVLLGPVNVENNADGGALVWWRVKWEGRIPEEHRVGYSPEECDLQFASTVLEVDTGGKSLKRVPGGWVGKYVRLAANYEDRYPDVISPILRLNSPDLGLVIRDLGEGVNRGLLVKRVGTCDAWWYDDAMVRLATPSEVARANPKAALQLARGVPVTDSNAAPGMLVRRSYDFGTVKENTEKAQMLGVLIKRMRKNEWQVQWSDGSVAVYKCGRDRRFQLCFVNVNRQAGAPVMTPIVFPQPPVDPDAEVQQQQPPMPPRKYVMPGFHASSGFGSPDYLYPVAQEPYEDVDNFSLEMAEMVQLAHGSRHFAGGQLRLFELCHALVPGEPVTIFTAKEGLWVSFGEEPQGAEDEEDEQAGPSQPSFLGRLVRPVRLGDKAGTSRSGAATLVPDPDVVWWLVQWENGKTGEWAVGTQGIVTALRVARANDFISPPPDAGKDAVLNSVRMLAPVVVYPFHDVPDVWRYICGAADSLSRLVNHVNLLLQQVAVLWCASVALESPTHHWSVWVKVHYPWQPNEPPPEDLDPDSAEMHAWLVHRFCAPEVAMRIVERAPPDEEGGPPFRDVTDEHLEEEEDEGAPHAVAKVQQSIARVTEELNAWHAHLQKECSRSPDPMSYGEHFKVNQTMNNLGLILQAPPGPVPWVQAYPDAQASEKPLYLNGELPMFAVWATTLNTQLLQLLQVTWRHHRLEGGPNIRDCVQRVYSIVHRQVVRAVSARVAQHYATATEKRRDYTQQVLDTVDQKLVAKVKEAVDACDWEGVLQLAQLICGVLQRVAKGVQVTMAAAGETQAMAQRAAVAKEEATSPEELVLVVKSARAAAKAFKAVAQAAATAGRAAAVAEQAAWGASQAAAGVSDVGSCVLACSVAREAVQVASQMSSLAGENGRAASSAAKQAAAYAQEYFKVLDEVTNEFEGGVHDWVHEAEKDAAEAESEVRGLDSAAVNVAGAAQHACSGAARLVTKFMKDKVDESRVAKEPDNAAELLLPASWMAVCARELLTACSSFNRVAASEAARSLAEVGKVLVEQATRRVGECARKQDDLPKDKTALFSAFTKACAMAVKAAKATLDSVGAVGQYTGELTPKAVEGAKESLRCIKPLADVVKPLGEQCKDAQSAGKQLFTARSLLAAAQAVVAAAQELYKDASTEADASLKELEQLVKAVVALAVSKQAKDEEVDSSLNDGAVSPCIQVDRPNLPYEVHGQLLRDLPQLSFRAVVEQHKSKESKVPRTSFRLVMEVDTSDGKSEEAEQVLEREYIKELLAPLDQMQARFNAAKSAYPNLLTEYQDAISELQKQMLRAGLDKPGKSTEKERLLSLNKQQLDRWGTAQQMFEAVTSLLDQGFNEAAEVLSSQLDPVDLPHQGEVQQGLEGCLMPDTEMPEDDFSVVIDKTLEDHAERARKREADEQAARAEQERLADQQAGDNHSEGGASEGLERQLSKVGAHPPEGA